MKRLIVFLFFIAAVFKTNAQPYVNIPDPAFRNLIDSLAPGSIVGTDMNTSHPGVTGLMFMEIGDPAVYDITGIQYFVSLTDLYSSGHGIGYIPALPPNLQFLNLPFCPLTGLPALPSGLMSLHVEGCDLSSLPSLPANLYVLSCSQNNLIALPALPSALSNIYCNDNSLASLPSLPSSLYYFDCRNNAPSDPHTFLPTLPNSLQNLYASGNSVYCLPNIPNNGNFYSDIPLTICQPQGTPDTWYAMKLMPNGLQKELATSFSVSGKGYVSCGNNGSGYSDDLWEFNPVTNTWTQKANLPGVARISPFSFSVGTKGYLGCGQQSTSPYSLNDFYEYNPVNNTWIQKANYPGIIYSGMGSFTVNSKGYVAGGSTIWSNPSYNELYEYNPATDTWAQKTALTGYGRKDFSCFAIGNKGYLCGGEYQNDLFGSCYAYDVSTDTWSTIAAMPVSNNEYAAFAINGRGYIVAGQQGSWFSGGSKKLYEYDPGTNYWYPKADILGTDRRRTTGFSINGRGYVTTGLMYNPQTGNYIRSGDIFEYTPATCLPTITTIAAGGSTTFCNGSSVTLSASPSTGLTYQWFNGTNLIPGATSVSYVASASGFYFVVSTNAGGCSFTSISVGVTSGVYPAAITPPGSVGMCPGGSVNFQVNVCTNCSYQWYKTGVVISGATGSSYIANQAGTYSVRVTTPSGCTGTSPYTNVSIINTNPVVSVIGTPNICSGDSVRVYTGNYSGTTYQWYKNGTIIPGITQYYYYAKAAGNYSVAITNQCGTFTSPAQAVTVNALPSATITPSGPTTFCSGGSVVLNVPAGTNKTYQWKKGVNLISGATLSSYTASTGGNYRVIVTNTVTGCSKTSGSATTVTVNALPSAAITPQGPNTFCAGGSVVLAANTGTGLTYKWKKGSNFISGATLSNYTATTGGNYRVQVNNSNGCSKTSALVAVSVPCKEGEVLMSDADFNVSVYPNPSAGDFVFKIENSGTEKISINVYDMIGKLVLSGTVSNSEFIISNAQLIPGIYSAVITNGKNKQVLKMVKTNK